MDENIDTGDGDICASFTQLLKGIQTETNVLKCVSQLRTLPPDDKITEKIFAMERAVQEIERNFEDFNEFLSSEMNTCDMMEKDIIVLAEQQELRIQELRRSLPQSLADAVSSFKATALSSKDQSVILEGSDTVTIAELDAIPKTTRGRLTIGIINGALSTLRQLIKDKTKTLQSNRKKMTRAQTKVYESYLIQRQADHGDVIFLSETEIRSSPIFEGGEASAKATLHTLRALNRIKLIRSSGENTYILA